MLHFGWLWISHCGKRSLKYSGKAKTFPVVEKMFVRTANAWSISFEAFWCVIGSGWKSFWDDLNFSQLVDILQFRQLQKAEHCKKISAVYTSSDEVVTLSSEGNGQVPGNKLCVGVKGQGGEEKEKETRTCSGFGLTSLWTIISMVNFVNCLFYMNEFTTCDSVNYKSQFITCKLFSDIQQQECQWLGSFLHISSLFHDNHFITENKEA